MSDKFDPLTDKELNQLDGFLLNRIDDDTDTTGKDEGVLESSTLDGFFTAIISGPQMIMPAQWLPAMWGDYEPDWDEKTFKRVFSLLTRHMNSIADHLMHEPQSYEPLFLQSEFEGKTVTIVDEWCCGYMRAVELSIAQWQLDSLDMSTLITPIRMFGTEEGWKKLADMNKAEDENMRQSITPNVREIYLYWLARRESEPVNAPFKNEQAPVGRNDPCPCGSGKKYKKCCLH